MGKSYQHNVRTLALSRTPICHFSYLNISNHSPPMVSSKLPASSAPLLLPTQRREPVWTFFLCVCLCVWLGQIFCSSFPACPLSFLHSPAAVWLNRLLNQPAGWQQEEVFRPVLWFIVLNSCWEHTGRILTFTFSHSVQACIEKDLQVRHKAR